MKRELSYRHMLVTAMPIQILLFLIDKKILGTYLNFMLHCKYSEQVIFSLIARRDLEEKDVLSRIYYIKHWLNNACLTVNCNSYKNFI